MIARGEYSLIYAAIGLSTGAISDGLYQFTGVYVFIMTLIAPVAMKNSNKIYKALSLITPKSIKKGAYGIAAKVTDSLSSKNSN